MSISGKLLNATQILFDLQQANEIAQSFSGCLEPEVIARRVTEGIVERFNCAFARIWLLEPDQTMLRLVASSGMYTHTDGFFGRVPMGAYKVGKIAQNRISFLSNNLAAEPWVGNRDWALANQIRGFAGYPLMIENRVIGVLAMFSCHVLEPEFLEVLQTLSTMATVALDTAQRQKQFRQASPALAPALSDQLAEILTATRLTLVGTEQPIGFSRSYLFLRAAEVLKQYRCAYGRLIYGDQETILEASLPSLPASPASAAHLIQASFQEIQAVAIQCGGSLQAQPTADQRAIQIRLAVPHLTAPVTPSRSAPSGLDPSRLDQSGPPSDSELRIQIRCRSPLLQVAFTKLAEIAGVTVCPTVNQTTGPADAPLLTDDPELAAAHRKLLWVVNSPRLTQSEPGSIELPLTGLPIGLPIGLPVGPPNSVARLDLAIQPTQFRQAVAAVTQGKSWGLPTAMLSERELEILALLTQGYRDRDIAQQLVISESTVKFHLNNAATKLQAKTRYQAIYRAIQQGWI